MRLRGCLVGGEGGCITLSAEEGGPEDIACFESSP